MQQPELKKSIAAVAEALAALTANQAMIIEVLHDKLPELSEVEMQTVEKCAHNNYAIAEKLQDILQQLGEE